MRITRGHHYLLVIKNCLKNVVRTVTLHGLSAAEVAKQLINHWVFSHGPPIDLIADNGRQTTSTFFQNVSNIINVHSSFTVTYESQTNGQVERLNHTILPAIRD